MPSPTTRAGSSRLLPQRPGAGDERGFTRLAFPAISTGVYGYPSAEAARVVADVIRERLPQLPALEVTLMFFSAADAQTFVQAAQR